MAYTQSQLDILDAAIAQGALVVKYGDKEVTYRSLKDMYQIRETMLLELGFIGTTSRRSYATFSKGLLATEEENLYNSNL